MAPEYVEEVIDALMERQFPFVSKIVVYICDLGIDVCIVQIFSYASPAATISDELAAKVNSSGIGLLSKWTPQPYILSHPVGFQFRCFILLSESCLHSF